jgi:hypothetical protein
LSEEARLHCQMFNIAIVRVELKVAYLMECTDLVRLKGTDDGVQNTAVVEENKVVFFPKEQVSGLFQI